MTLFEEYDVACAAHPGALILFRVGDWYEALGEPNAELMRDVLGVSITRRGDRRVAGLPAWADYRIQRLVDDSRVAFVVVYDHAEDPRDAAREGRPVRRIARRIDRVG